MNSALAENTVKNTWLKARGLDKLSFDKVTHEAF